MVIDCPDINSIERCHHLLCKLDGLILIAHLNALLRFPCGCNESQILSSRRLDNWFFFLCEDIGTSWDKIVTAIEAMQLPAPQMIRYEESTRLILFPACRSAWEHQASPEWCFLPISPTEKDLDSLTPAQQYIKAYQGSFEGTDDKATGWVNHEQIHQVYPLLGIGICCQLAGNLLAICWRDDSYVVFSMEAETIKNGFKNG